MVVQGRSSGAGPVRATTSVAPVFMPMFPLESVLVPGMVLPLQVFEDRYIEMVEYCLEAKREFGVVLIERGREVGGGDVRTTVGTAAEIVKAEQVADGRWGVIAVGVRRIRVVAWLDDDPYPRAKVVPWPDESAPELGTVEGKLTMAATYGRVSGAVRRAVGLAVELGDQPARTIELTDEPDLGSYQLAMIAPLGPFDQNLLLCAPGPQQRLALLEEMISEKIVDLEARIAAG